MSSIFGVSSPVLDLLQILYQDLYIRTVIGQTTIDRGLQSLLISGVAFLFGLVFIYFGFDEWKKKRLIQDTPTEPIRSIAAGRTEIKGTATPTEGTLEQPFAEGNCLYADWKIEEYRTDDNEHADWDTIDRGEVAVPFELNDGTGGVRVEASTDADWEISDDNRTQTAVDSGEEPPDTVQSFLETDTHIEVDESMFAADRRYTQEVLPPGEETYVFGQATERETPSGTNGQRLRMERDSGTDRFIISDMTEQELEGTLSRRTPLLILIGLIASAGSLYGMLWSLGIT